MAEAPLFIHAGAHRTGTSSFQLCLHKNRKALGAVKQELDPNWTMNPGLLIDRPTNLKVVG